MHKTHLALSSACLTCFIFLGVSRLHSEESSFGEQLLQLFPQADTNHDGTLSADEEDAVSQRIMQRFPQADQNGDGALSAAEKDRVLRLATAMRQRTAKPTKPSGGFFGTWSSDAEKEPSFSNVSYGANERNVLDVWLAESTTPTPVAIYIHGGGFKAGSKEKLNAADRDALLDAGISVASINYRLITTDPLPTAHHDAKRAVQFIRSKADDWNIAKDRIAAFGGSAGAQICMWIAYSEDMADPTNSDPVERESTRLTCLATKGGQTSNERSFYQTKILPLLHDGTPAESLIKPLAGEMEPEAVLLKTWGAHSLAEVDEKKRNYSALNLLTADAPPIFMSYSMPPDGKKPRDPKQVRGWLIHHVVFGLELKDKAERTGAQAFLQYPGATTPYNSAVDFLKSNLLMSNER